MEPETDNVWITLVCSRGTGNIHIEDPLREQPTNTITLVSGTITEGYAATMGRADKELGFPPGAVADAPSTSPLMRHFRQTGELKFQGGQEMPIRREDERQQIDAFFSRCG